MLLEPHPQGVFECRDIESDVRALSIGDHAPDSLKIPGVASERPPQPGVQHKFGGGAEGSGNHDGSSHPSQRSHRGQQVGVKAAKCRLGLAPFRLDDAIQDSLLFVTEDAP